MNKQINKTKDIANNITKKIQSGELNMKPKFYFVLGSILSSAGVLIFSILGTYFANMIIHRIRIGKMVTELRKAPISFRFSMFLRVFPWEYLLLSIGFIILGLYLIRKFDVSYKKSYVFLVTIFLTGVILTAFVIDKSGLNERAKKIRYIKGVYGEHNQLPQEKPYIKGLRDQRLQPRHDFERKLPPRLYK
jgi:hypothetical protein